MKNKNLVVLESFHLNSVARRGNKSHYSWRIGTMDSFGGNSISFIQVQRGFSFNLSAPSFEPSFSMRINA